MLADICTGLISVFTLPSIGAIALGILTGLIFGAIPGISGKTISSGVAAAGEVADVEYVPNRRKLVEELVDLVRPGDLLITQGAGDVTQIGPLFIEAMRERAAKE